MMKKINLIFLLILTFPLILMNKNVRATESARTKRTSITKVPENLFLFDPYVLRLWNNEGERLNDAWISLKVENQNPDTNRPEPPLFFEYTNEGNGIFISDINPYRLEGKTFTLYVHAEGHKEYQISFNKLNKDVTVVLDVLDVR